MLENEPVITINGHTLEPAQAMTVRVAVVSFMSQMQDIDALGTDEHGRRMAALYREHLGRIQRMMRDD